MKKQKIIYYNDELNDEFSGAEIKPRKIDENYKYIHKNIIWNITAFFLQNILSLPIKYLYANIKLKIKYIGKEKYGREKKDRIRSGRNGTLCKDKKRFRKLSSGYGI